MLEPGWKNRMGYYRMVVRCTEWIERQKISLLDVRGLGKGSLRLLYKANMKTADQIMARSTDEIINTLAAEGGFIRDGKSTRELVETWKRSIRSLWLANVGTSLPDGWDGPLDE